MPHGKHRDIFNPSPSVTNEPRTQQKHFYILQPVPHKPFRHQTACTCSLSRGGSRGVFRVWRPPSKLGLILKQALQIIIIIDAKISISICTFKCYRTMSEDSRKKQCTMDIRTFFASERYYSINDKLLTGKSATSVATC